MAVLHKLRVSRIKLMRLQKGMRSLATGAVEAMVLLLWSPGLGAGPVELRLKVRIDK
jgi:hypothetical protein